MFICIEGIDGAGKSSQVVALEGWLREQGREVTVVRDPGGTPAGEAIRSLLLDSDLQLHRRSEALLYMAARSQLAETTIRPALQRDGIVVADRFLLSNVAYQSVGEGAMTAEELWRLGELAIGGLRPDLVLLLDLPADQAMHRLDRPKDRMERRGPAYLEAVRQVFLRELPRAARRVDVIDASNPSERVTQLIRQSVHLR
jgi:dTMP kinase